jgi:Transglycosylase SLT domain
MSGAQTLIPLQAKGIDVFGTLGQIADVAQRQAQAKFTGAQTGLVGEQARGAAIQNFLAGLKANAVAAAFGAPPMGGNALAGLSAPGPTSGGQAGAAPAALPPGYSMTGSPYGAMMTPYGVALPQLQVGLAWGSNDPIKAMGDLLKQRATTLNQLLVPVSNADEYNAVLGKAYGAGMISPDDYARHYQDASKPPDQWQNYRRLVLQSTQDPDAYANNLFKAAGEGLGPSETTGVIGPAPGAIAGAAAKASAEAWAKVNPQIAEAYGRPVLQPGNVFAPPAATLGAPPGVGAGAGTEAPASVPNATAAALASIPNDAVRSRAVSAAVKAGLPVEAWAPWVATVQHETGWNLAAPIGGKGEIGVGQVMPTTGKTLGYTPEQLADPDTNMLASARYFGQQWAAGGNDPAKAAAGYNTGDVNGKAPDYVADVSRRLGGFGYPGVGAQIAPGVTTRTLPGGGTVTTDTRPQQAAMYEADMKMVPDLEEQDRAVQANMQRLYDMRDLINQLPMSGSAGDLRARAANFVQTFIQPVPGMGQAAADFLSKVGDLPPAAIVQQLNKLTIQNAGLQEKTTVGARGSIGLTRLFIQSNPGFDMQQSAAHDIANLQLVQNLMEHDYLSGRIAHVSNQPGYIAGTANYVPGAEFDNQFASQDNAKTYFATVQAMNGKTAAQWAAPLGNDPAKIRAVLDIARRADPTATFHWFDGKVYRFAQMAPR